MKEHSLLCKTWREQNRERTREIALKYYYKRRDKVLAYKKKYYAEHRMEILKKSKNYYEQNREKANAYRRKWSKTKVGRSIVKAASNRRRKHGIHISATKIRAVEDFNSLEYGELTCVYCFKPIAESYNLDHVVPLSRGGSSKMENLAISCSRCNRKKGNKTAKEFDYAKNGVRKAG